MTKKKIFEIGETMKWYNTKEVPYLVTANIVEIDNYDFVIRLSDESGEYEDVLVKMNSEQAVRLSEEIQDFVNRMIKKYHDNN